MDAAIELRGLTKRYGKARGIEGLDLVVARGEVFGFLGPNGAGKTTTIRTMLDFQRPTAGTATLLGFDSQRDAVEIHRRTGYLPGDLALYERLTGRHMTDWLAALRGIGVPAGYVGGFLRTTPPDGQERLQGADAMHAWVRIWCGVDMGWVEYDPTNAMFGWVIR